MSVAILIILMQCAATVHGLTMTDYLKQYRETNENEKLSELEAKIAAEREVLAADVFQSNLTVSPFSQNVGQTLGDDHSNYSTSGYSIEYEQATPWGTSLSLNASEADADQRLTTERSYTLSLSQSLNRNAFGQATRQLRDLARANHESAQADYADEVAKSCKTGAELYINAYGAQENFRILTEQKEIAERALKYSERAYQKKLARKIDILGARADMIDIESRKDQRSFTLKSRLESLYAPLGQTVPQSIKLGTPEWEPPRAPANPLPQIQAAEKLVEAKQLNLDAVYSQKQNLPVNLGVQIGQNEGFTTDDYKETTTTLTLSMGWPLIEQSDGADENIAAHELLQAELNLQRLKEVEKQNRQISDWRKGHLLQQIEQSEQKLKLYQQQISEALNFLNAGRIEFSDYIVYRERMLTENLKLVDLKVQHRQNQLEWAYRNGALGSECGGLL